MERNSNVGSSLPNGNREQQQRLKHKSLEIKLEEFVMKFVKEFEAKLTSYALILDGVIVKSGCIANSYAEKVGQGLGVALGGTLGLSVGLPGAGASAGKTVVGAIAKGIGRSVGKEFHRQKVTKLSEFIYYFEQNRTEFRKMLVKVGLDIFQSFEMQFDRVSSDLGERGAMNKLAIDAMNRAVEYIARTSAETQLDHHSLILEGVKLGQSKGEPVLGKPVPGRHSGYEIIYHHESKETKWKSASLFSKVGIVIINKRDKTYYQAKDGKNKCAKYGFRRCFTREIWEQIESSYAKIDLYRTNSQFLDYDYSNLGVSEQKVNEICAKLESERDQTLGIDRINILLNESKDEILEKLQLLKPIYDKLESEILFNVECNLKNLNLEKYYSKFNLKVKQILDEISRGNDVTRSKLEEIHVSLDELNDKIDSAHQTIFHNSIWFDVRNNLITFTGREAILAQIETDLKSGPVVICGLGGIGKSELALKYAHGRYERSDNVMWVNAETEESIAGSVWQLAQVLGVNKMDASGRERDLDVVIPEIYKIIFARNCLLILDNAKLFSHIEPLLRWSPDVTQFQPEVIVTSRNSSEWESARFSVKIIQLEVFERSEAINFVKKSLSLDYTSDIDKLIDVLGNFPLALQHAVTNIKITDANYRKRNQHFTIENFLRNFEKEPRKLLSGRLPLDMYRQPCSIFIVVSFAFKELLETETELGAKAQLVLRMASYMAPENIREDFFHDEIPEQEELWEIMSLLEKYSLVKMNEGKLSVHRLVQQAIRLESEAEEEAVLRKVLHSLMKRLKNWNNIRFDVSHIVSVWDHACDYDNLIDEFVVHFSNEYYPYTSFLQTLLQRERLQVLRKIDRRIQNASSFNRFNSRLKKMQFYKQFNLMKLARNYLTMPYISVIFFVAICLRRFI